jgi:hypothetical protein
MDKFEKFIKENNAAFNEHKADKAKMWAAISTELEAPKTTVIPLWRKLPVKIAASILIVLGIVSIINFSLTNTSPNYANAELQEIDMYYTKMIQSQVKLVQNNQHLSASNKEDFLKFMDELDAEYEDLKLDLADNLDNELVLEAIINNYKKRIELIENLLQQINESKNNTHENEYIL